MQFGLVAAGALAKTRFGATPAYTRLEPQSDAGGDPTPGLEAAVHDPLWALLRQWQFAEWLGEDNGRPLGVSVKWTTTPLQTLTVGDGATRTSPIGDATLLDPAIESGASMGAMLRARAEAGRALAVALEEAGVANAGAQLAKAYPFAASDVAAAPPALARVLRVGVDGRAAAAGLGAAMPSWIAAAAGGATAAWLAWWRGNVEPAPGPSGWDRKRLEHRFSIDTGQGLGFTATEHLGGAVDWWNVDATGAPPPPSAVRSASLLAQPLRCPGMPADRYWEFEDGSVNLGGTNVETNDPVRRALIDFVTVFGADWFSVPVTVPAGGLTTITSLTVTDTFGGEPTRIDPPADGPFRLFQVTRADGKGCLPGLLTLPAASTTLDGPPIESVMILRDEVANLGWAVEERVEDANLGSRLRRDEPAKVAAPASPPDAAFPPGTPAPELRYTLQTEVPPWWIPLVPVQTDGKGGFTMRKGTMTDTDESRSRLLAGPGAVDFMDQEVPDAGLRVDRVPRLARGPDGSLRRWTAFQVRSVSAPAESGLAFDGAQAI